MPLFDLILLAIVQGLTEFLPVSSSGHLVVTNAVLQALGGEQVDFDQMLEVNIVLHVGTLLAVVAFYWRELTRLLTTDRRVALLLIVGTIPAAVIGFPLKHFAEETLNSPLLAGLMFPVTAAILYFGSRVRQDDGGADYQDLSYGRVLGIGAMQALALLPGISRSGSTIAGGLAAGLSRQAAGTFAFLLAVPAIGGPGLIEVVKLIKRSGEESAASSVAPLDLAIAAVVSFAVGYLALWQLLKFVRQGRLALFCWYLVPLGVAVTAWQLWLRATGG
ncbi:Undecaprenyl-diphosphatase [Posidoniimonas corsicana]|uniref:Undecaprenyl-diphosphatase n=1 Tax=Posidoniimonas corsicana TaxID=1938618 RepID=A0A5C5VDP8_9BACT|nr:undecaprenyl-diphosphate phosphatase [Posidoniimonas corsicana]TWT36728.1 Undecaprenyl-diphosphatase [Posidoniimonas corsicana]